MSEFHQMIRNPAYDGSSEEDEDIDPVDITPFISSISVPIVTVPARTRTGLRALRTELRMRMMLHQGWRQMNPHQLEMKDLP